MAGAHGAVVNTEFDAEWARARDAGEIDPRLLVLLDECAERGVRWYPSFVGYAMIEWPVRKQAVRTYGPGLGILDTDAYRAKVIALEIKNLRRTLDRFTRGEAAIDPGTPVLLVTGARGLASQPHARRWADESLRVAIDALPRDAYVVTGDAPGPDTWAREWARVIGLRVVVYELSGHRAVQRRDGTVVRPTRWTTQIPTGDRRWPLVRNQAMVEAVARAHRTGGIDARVLALFAPWSATHGTAHTADIAERAGLPVERLTFSG